MGIEYFKLPIFDRRPYCDPAEWAQRYRYMKTTASMFSFEQSPYFELPNQVMGDLAGTACVVLKVPSQTGKTETLINMLGWIVEYDRANTLLIMDTKTSGIALSKNRIRPFLRDVCGLDYSKTASSKGKDNDHSMNAVDLGIGRGANVKIGSSRCAGDL